ncbi:unknown [Ruminococcus sp. CAG:382]|nr:unknown [Ruminococcus sp. CAG:382]
MAAVSDGYHAHAVFLCLFDSHAHRFVADDLTHAVVTVNDRRCGRFAHDFEICHGVLDARLDTVDVDGLEAVDTVAFNAALVGGEKHVGADFGVLAGHTHADKCVGDEAVKSFPVADYFCHWFCSFLGKKFPYSPRSVSADAFLRLTNGVTTYL